MTIVFIVFIIIVIAAIISVSSGNAAGKKLKALEDEYHRLLKGSNKRAALQAGRAYYSALRQGKALTIYDEQAITNDLSTMEQP